MPGKQFPGFPKGRLRATPIPDLFFREVLPVIQDLAELKVLLHIFWLIQDRNRPLKGISFAELEADRVLALSLNARTDEERITALRAALSAAVERGTLLRLQTHTDSKVNEWFFLNTESGRETAARVRAGEIDLGGVLLPEVTSELPARGNIYNLYERNIGLLSPLIVEELEEAEKRYPKEWIEEAFKIAVENNVRRWRYIRAILERWQDEGKNEGTTRASSEDGSYYLKSKYADRIKH